MSTKPLENLLKEDRVFPPDSAFVAQANAQPGIYEQADQDWTNYWLIQALQRLTWFSPPVRALDDSNPPFYRWFPDGEINLSFNCLDRHLESSGDKVAYHWIGEPGDTRTLTYRDLSTMVNQFANGLKSLGLKKGDTAALYMGMVPELPVAMLACARLGIVHSAVFGGFSSDSLSDRIIDASCKVVVTMDGAWRAGKVVPLKANTDVALARTPSVEHVIVLKRTGTEVHMKPGRDLWWEDLV
ncbi:MAG: AMP-binding protein, partial [Acidimicrobiia bacterium]